eukprot:3392983-Rhodomonas_salina.1
MNTTHPPIASYLGTHPGRYVSTAQVHHHTRAQNATIRQLCTGQCTAIRELQTPPYASSTAQCTATRELSAAAQGGDGSDRRVSRQVRRRKAPHPPGRRQGYKRPHRPD